LRPCCWGAGSTIDRIKAILTDNDSIVLADFDNKTGDSLGTRPVAEIDDNPAALVLGQRAPPRQGPLVPSLRSG